MRVLLVVSVSFALALSTVAFMPPVRVAAAAGTYWFHGQPTDQADKVAGLAGATFNTTPPTGLAPVVQTTTGVAN